ncbi:MAG: hypothetical protein AAFY20_26120 [Cyanobacteria bacterium J06639_14]
MSAQQQALISTVCVAAYLISVLVFAGIFIGGLFRKVARSRALQYRSRQFHCGNCQYFTGEPLLKCAVHPVEALTEAALDCRDFEATLPKADQE